jgi:hypothetical protein
MIPRFFFFPLYYIQIAIKSQLIFHFCNYHTQKLVQKYQIFLFGLSNTKYMITFIAFLLTLAGSINWLLIGLLQYDFVAGMFGYQASIFSRLCYILVGVAALYLIIRIIANKGTFKIYERRKKKHQEEQIVDTNSEHVRDNY